LSTSCSAPPENGPQTARGVVEMHYDKVTAFS